MNLLWAARSKLVRQNLKIFQLRVQIIIIMQAFYLFLGYLLMTSWLFKWNKILILVIVRAIFDWLQTWNAPSIEFRTGLLNPIS